MVPDLDAPYEPWRPRPGQHVRVRRSGECPGWHHRRAGDDDGAVGTVVERRPWPVADHPYVVAFAGALPDGLYAAAELEPVDGAIRRGDGTAR